jgi:predicted ATPase
MTLTAGSKLSRYEIRRQLGSGGMGDVYLAEDPKLLRQIALKVLPAEFSQDSRQSERFLREAQAASTLNHPNICTIYEINDDHKPPFIVMEYVEGETIAEKLKSGRLEVADVLKIALQVAGALSDAHAHGIVHRDIKPANIIVNQRGQAKLLDFGIAKKVTAELEVDTEAETNPDLTQAGSILGTVAYMSPEQARALAVDARTDLWSFGVVLYEMLTGRKPFAEATTSDILAAILRSEPAGLREFNDAVPGELERIVLKTLRKNREERYASARDLFADLKRLKKQWELPATPDAREVETKVFRVLSSEEASYLPRNNLSGRMPRLIGREREVEQIKTLLRSDDVHLLTLSGIGGTGKTTLAQAVAREMIAEFSHGVFFIELAAITQPDLVASTIAQPLGIKETGGEPLMDALKEHLRDKHMLLILDNLEQVLAAAANIAELVTTGPLKILVTSRARLHLTAEQELVLPPLGVPTEDSTNSLADLEKIDAVKLFVERARSVRSDFALTEENAGSVAEICTRLDGLPLAIELAAARVRILSVETIRAKLGDSLKLLTGGARDLPARQQTMRGAIEWSYHLLNEAEKALFRRLAVFAGGFRLEAAETICSASSSEAAEVLDLVTSLVDKSLLVSKSAANREPRFRMLTVIREYAGEVLQTAGDAEEMREGHANYFLELGESDLYLDGARGASWVNRLEEEHGNLRAALKWLLATDPEKAARLAAGLRSFWIMHGHLTEGRDWLEEALKQSSKISAPLRRALLTSAGSMAQLRGDHERASQLYQHGLAEAKAANDLRQMALAGRGLGATAYLQGDYKAARCYVEEALMISRDLNDQFAIAASLNRLGDLARMESNYAVAQTFFEESIAILRELGNKSAVSNSLNNLGGATFADGDHAAAHGYFTEALTTAREFGDKIVISHCLDGFAALATERGDSKVATRLAGAAEAVRRSIGFQREPAESRFRSAYLEKLEVDETTLLARYEQEGKLKLDEAIALALAQDSRGTAAA